MLCPSTTDTPVRTPLDEGYAPGKNTNIHGEVLTSVFALIMVYIHGEACIINSPNPAGSMIEPVGYTY